MMSSRVPRMMALISQDFMPGKGFILSTVNLLFRMVIHKQYVEFNKMSTKRNHCGPILLRGNSLNAIPNTVLFGIKIPAIGVILLRIKIAIMRGAPRRSSRCVVKCATPLFCT